MKTGLHFSASIEPHAFRMAAPSVLRSHGALGAFSRRLFPTLPLGGGQILRDCVTNGREGAQIRKDRLQIVIG